MTIFSVFLSEDAVSHPPTRAFVRSLVEKGLAPGEQYYPLLKFFQRDGELNDLLTCLGSLTPAAPNLSDADRLPARLVDSQQRAIRCLRVGQRQDGGWGPVFGESSLWHTIAAVLYLTAARKHPAFSDLVDEEYILLPGWAYLEQHTDDWVASSIGAQDRHSVYDLCQMAHVFFQGGREYLRRETGVRILRSIEYLYHAQNADGGWDAWLWGYAVPPPTRVFSEVGATALVARLLCEVGDERLESPLTRAVNWLLETQNLDGSWSDGTCRPDLPAYTLTGDPRASKTCDAVGALLAIQPGDTPNEAIQNAIRRGLCWLLLRTFPLLGKPLNPAAWGWGYTTDDYESMTQVLEVLLALPQPPQALLAACAAWLLEGQHRMEGDCEDGRWVLGHTARIALALKKVLGNHRSTGAPVDR